MPLTDKQARFVEEYLVDLNATQAAIRAGYSARTAEQQGPRLLGNAGVAAAIREAQARRSARTEVTQDRVLQELARIGFADIRKAVRWGASVAVPWAGDARNADDVDADGEAYKVHHPIALIDADAIDPDTAAAIAEVALTKEGLRVKLHDKLGALDKIAKHLGLYAPERHEHTGRDGKPIQTETAVRPDLSDLDQDERDALRALLERRARRSGGGDP